MTTLIPTIEAIARRAMIVLFVFAVCVGCDEEDNDPQADASQHSVSQDTGQKSGDLENYPKKNCDDGVQNGDESDIDCGGSCTRCADGQTCSMSVDCKSSMCSDSVCISCSDGVRNGTETDIDCGGGQCSACRDGKACETSDDCLTKQCEDGICASCSDGIKNGDETDTDCGGSCGKCANGSACLSSDDCYSDLCKNDVCMCVRQCSCPEPSWHDPYDCGDDGCGGTCGTCGVGKTCWHRRCYSTICANACTEFLARIGRDIETAQLNNVDDGEGGITQCYCDPKPCQ